jgi:hypothetical protein
MPKMSVEVAIEVLRELLDNMVYARDKKLVGYKENERFIDSIDFIITALLSADKDKRIKELEAELQRMKGVLREIGKPLCKCGGSKAKWAPEIKCTICGKVLPDLDEPAEPKPPEKGIEPLDIQKIEEIIDAEVATMTTILSKAILNRGGQ